jgi:predicted transcriptional regulator
LRISGERKDNDKVLKPPEKMASISVDIISKKLIDEVKYFKETKNLSITEIAKLTGRARTTIYKA